MSSMLKLLSVSALASLALFGATDEQIIKFVKRGLGKNPAITVKSVKIADRVLLDNPKGWSAYFITFDLELKRGKESIDISDNDIIFAKDNLISPDFIDVRSNRSIKHRLSPAVKESFYDKEHLLYGSEKAKHKILVFSDPNCPFCKDLVPPIMEAALKYPDTFALYYYHLPLLKLHPGSLALCKAMIVLQKRGQKDLFLKIYETDFDYSLEEEEKVLKELNEKLGTDLTKSDIDQPWVTEALKRDMDRAKELFVKGTPTVFIDGKKDPSKEEYRKFIPKGGK